MYSPVEINDYLERILPLVQKPGRYTGGEFNQIVKNWDSVSVHVALLFPDIYDLGMSNLGLAILYETLNQRSDVLAERTYSPWFDMEDVLRSNQIPLYSLETKHLIREFDILGISLPYESLYTNALNALDLAGIPIYASQRLMDYPLIIAGGHSTFNPEPMHAFIDAFVIGEGEEVIHEIVDVYKNWKMCAATRDELLTRISKLWGVYVPSLYQAHYYQGGIFSHIGSLDDSATLPITKRFVAKLPPPVKNFIVPYIETVHNRIPIEIMRGCTRGCRFCQAGIITRPVRERPVNEIIFAIEESLENTGFEEIGLLSLSSSDYTHILELVKVVNARFRDKHLSISLPSLRIESFSINLMDALKNSRRSGFTLAPEAATERMREIINKPVSTQQLLETTRAIFARGWSNIKLYFMIGHPLETIEDVQAIADLCKSVLAEGRKIAGMRAQVTAGISTFIPKPHTPFQWVSCDTIDQIREKQALLKRTIHGKGLKLNWNSPEETMLEAWLSRGDRRMAEVIFQAWKRGAKFDAWKDHFSYNIWLDAFSAVNLEPSFYTHRERPIDETLPWDHIDTAYHKKNLIEDYLWSYQGKTRPDCRERCFACGILPAFADMRRKNPGSEWQCPQVKSKRIPVVETLNNDACSN